MRGRDIVPQAFGDYRAVWLSIRALEWASDSSSANLLLYDMRQVTTLSINQLPYLSYRDTNHRICLLGLF